MIVRWSISELTDVLGELGVSRPYALATSRFAEVPFDDVGRWSEVPTDSVGEVSRSAHEAGADVLVALGGGSTIDVGKAASAEADLPLVSIPTTYSGAEWTTFFGVRDPGRRLRGGGAGAWTVGIVYEPRYTVDLPLKETVGTALNALAHSAEALYVLERNDEADLLALAGAVLIGDWLPVVVARPDDLEARTQLLHGASESGAALGKSMLGLGHAMAQALGGSYGLPHGAMNALCLPPALRFNESVVPEALARLGTALRTDDPASRLEELAALGEFGRLRDFGIPEEDLPGVSEAVVSRAGAKSNPRVASPADVEGLLRSIW